jgi:urease accessory protein
MARTNRFASLLALSWVPSLALAHPNHDLTHDFGAGFMHPLTGVDHLLAMLAVGLWAAHLGKRAVWLLPIAFPLAMLVGAALSVVGIALPAIEPAIALSVLMLGGLVAFRVRIQDALAAMLVAAFAVFHGYAHANEADSFAASFASGFVVATLLLHLVGIALAAALMKHDMRNMRLAGSVIGAAGVALLISV